MTKRVDIYLSDKELKFLKWLVKYDNSEDSKDYDTDIKWTLSKEIEVMAVLKIQESMNFYMNEGLYKDTE